MKNFSLTDEQKSFLLNYCPADKHFTSIEEIHAIRDAIPASSDVRNLVVEFYSELFDNEEDKEKCYDYMVAMQSVTTVIDYLRYGLI